MDRFFDLILQFDFLFSNRFLFQIFIFFELLDQIRIDGVLKRLGYLLNFGDKLRHKTVVLSFWFDFFKNFKDLILIVEALQIFFDHLEVLRVNLKLLFPKIIIDVSADLMEIIFFWTIELAHEKFVVKICQIYWLLEMSILEDRFQGDQGDLIFLVFTVLQSLFVAIFNYFFIFLVQYIFKLGEIFFCLDCKWGLFREDIDIFENCFRVLGVIIVFQLEDNLLNVFLGFLKVTFFDIYKGKVNERL